MPSGSTEAPTVFKKGLLMQVLKSLRRVAAALSLGVAALASHAAVTTQLGFLVDGSGSIGSTNFNIMRSGYVAAMNALPTDGTIEVTLYRFQGNTSNQIVAPTVVTGASLAGIISQINGMAFLGGGTPTDVGINSITSAMVGSSNYSAGLRSIINLATDGVPNSQANTIAAAVASKAAGIDALTAEGLGASLDVGFLQDIVFSPIAGPCNNCGTVLADGSTPTDPMTTNPWVLRVNDFQDFERAMLAKVQAVVNPTPEPGALALVALALGALGATRRRQA